MIKTRYGYHFYVSEMLCTVLPDNTLLKDLLSVYKDKSLERQFVYSYCNKDGRYVLCNHFIHDFELLLLYLPLNVPSEDSYIFNVSDVQSLYERTLGSFNCMELFSLVIDIIKTRDKTGLFFDLMSLDATVMWSMNKLNMFRAYYNIFNKQSGDLFVKSDVVIDDFLTHKFHFVPVCRDYSKVKCNIAPHDFWELPNRDVYLGYRDFTRDCM